MRRQQIIAIVVVLLLAGGAGAGYQFYFRPALEKFAEDQQYLAALNTKLKSLQATFPGGKPEAAVLRVKEKVQPWRDTLEQRARQFTIRDFTKIDPLPKTAVLKAYYEQTAQKMEADILTELAVKGIYYNRAIDFFFRAAKPGTLAGKSVNEGQVQHWLTSIKLGTSITRMLIKFDLGGIEDIHVWTPRITQDGFFSHAVGVSMWMTLDQFCRFIEKLPSDETMFISLEGFRIGNTALRASTDPYLKIELTFRIDYFNYEPAPVRTASAAPSGSAPASSPAGQPDDQIMQEVKERRAGTQPRPRTRRSTRIRGQRVARRRTRCRWAPSVSDTVAT